MNPRAHAQTVGPERVVLIAESTLSAESVSAESGEGEWARFYPQSSATVGWAALHMTAYTDRYLHNPGGDVTQRLPGIGDEEASTGARQIFDASNRLLGRTANLTRMLSHSPDLARWFLGFTAAVRQPNAGAVSSARLRNLATRF